MTKKTASAPPSAMSQALDQARAAAGRGEVPVGAVIVDGASGEILAAQGNRVIELKDPGAHAEMLVIREAARRIANERLDGCDIYVTLEPCPMCAQAISFARLRRLYYGAEDAKGGGVLHGARIFSQPSCHHRPEILGDISASEAGNILRDFFKARR